MNPKVSVITTVLNDKENIQYTIDSILEQDYSPLEYIIIDGNSTDGTSEVINKNIYNIDLFISEKDGGISSAFNKGINRSTGDYIIFMGAGDKFINKNSISLLMTNVNIDNDMMICGRVKRVNHLRKTIYVTDYVSKLSRFSLLFKMGVSHQGIATHRNLFNSYGKFDEKLKFAMDYDFLIRVIKHNINIKFCNEIISEWRDGGIGQNNILGVLEEYHKIKIKNKLAPYLILSYINLYIILKYKLKKYLLNE